MEFSDSDFKYDAEDAIGLGLTQAFGFVLAVLAGVSYGSHYVGIVGDFGEPFEIPMPAISTPALAFLAAASVAALPARFRHVWSEPRARGRIIAGLAQMAVVAAAAGLVGFLLAGNRLDVNTPGQTIVPWLWYGLVAGAVVHGACAIIAFALLMLKRELPDVAD